MTSENKTSSLIEAITRYLEIHPNAADTLEGVARWWLPAAYKLKSINKVQAALDVLIEQGVIKRTKTADGKVIFSGKRTNQH